MSSHGKRVVGHFELCSKAPPARTIPMAAIPKSADQPLRRQRNTVSGWTIIRLSRQPDHQCDSKIHRSRSKGRKQGRRVRSCSSTAIAWRSAIISNTSAVRVRGRRATTGSARFPGIAMKLAYPKLKPPLNLRGSGFEKGQVFICHQPYETHFS
jgi:hypothetical protein